MFFGRGEHDAVFDLSRGPEFDKTRAAVIARFRPRRENSPGQREQVCRKLWLGVLINYLRSAGRSAGFVIPADQPLGRAVVGPVDPALDADPAALYFKVVELPLDRSPQPAFL